MTEGHQKGKRGKEKGEGRRRGEERREKEWESRELEGVKVVIFRVRKFSLEDEQHSAFLARVRGCKQWY